MVKNKIEAAVQQFIDKSTDKVPFENSEQSRIKLLSDLKYHLCICFAGDIEIESITILNSIIKVYPIKGLSISVIPIYQNNECKIHVA